MTWTLNSIISMANQTTDEVWLTLITIEHSSMSTLYLVCNPTSITSNGNEFQPVMMDVSLPPSEPDSVGSAKLTIDHVDQSVLYAIADVTGQPNVTIEIVLASAPDDVLKSQTMRMVSVETDLHNLVCNLEGPDFFNETMPGVMMNRLSCPGLFRVRP